MSLVAKFFIAAISFLRPANDALFFLKLPQMEHSYAS